MKAFKDLKKTIDILRSPNGCPWDKKQTHDSLLSYLFEETNEVIDAIINNDPDELKEELGDLLLQILLHARIAEEQKKFTIEDVIISLNEKLIRRHPHVFSDRNADNADQVVVLWEEIKQQEKEHKKFKSIFDKIPKNFAPILKSYKLQKEAGKVGFDWPDYTGVLEKIEEEIQELKQAIDEKDNKTHLEHEIGDVLFSIINLGRFFKIKSDIALIKANKRFIERFQYIEKQIDSAGKSFKDFTLEELEKLWQEAKKEEESKK